MKQLGDFELVFLHHIEKIYFEEKKAKFAM